MTGEENYIAFLQLPPHEAVFIVGAVHQRFIELLDDDAQFNV